MENKIYLEDFRQNDYLSTVLAILSDSSNPKIEMTFNTYAMHAFYSVSDDISDLENEKHFVNNGRRTPISLSLLYLTLEAYINGLCKCISRLFGKDPEVIIKKDIGSRISFLLSELLYDEKAVKKTKLYNRVNEFRQFRNELFHDRNVGDPIHFKQTNFSSIPVLSNQCDTFQALLIALEVIYLFRYSIPGMDLMPNISIGNSRVLHFDKLDILYRNYLKPYFEETLKKHRLNLRIELCVDRFSALPPSKAVYPGEIVIIGRVVQADEYKYNLTQTDTNLGRDLYRQIIQNYNLPDGHVSGQNFTVNWPGLYESRFPMRR